MDHGNARIGLAVSDELGLVARPLRIVKHVSRAADAEVVAAVAGEQAVGEVVIGLPTGSEGEIGPQARTVKRFGEALAGLVSVPVVYWDESYSTRAAKARRGRRAQGPVDAEAAAVILQDYLDAQAGA